MNINDAFALAPFSCLTPAEKDKILDILKSVLRKDGLNEGIEGGAIAHGK